ncbi:MAG: hypothetical protein MUO94_07890 [Thermoplasmata archaeon]|nr:hypothetical protein [Thermoplasmata archaeon]
MVLMVEREFPECTTFGAVIRFSLELETGAMAVYEELAKRPGLAAAAEAFKANAAAHKKREGVLEHTRREKLNEMILEPIQDLNGADYIPNLEVPTELDVKGAVAFVSAVEDTSSKFYLEASKVAKMLMAEAARIMERLGKENMSLSEKLSGL